MTTTDQDFTQEELEYMGQTGQIPLSQVPHVDDYEPVFEETVRDTVTTEAGWIVDAETGEVVGHIDERPEFHVVDLSSAEWVLEKMQAEDAEIAGLHLRLQAISQQIGAMVREHTNRRTWLETRFGRELESFAREKLDGVKARSFKTPFGTIGFRAVPSSIKVTDQAVAVEWAREHAPDAIKVTESVIVTPLKGMEPNLPDLLFEVTPPSDRFYVKTGVGGK